MGDYWTYLSRYEISRNYAFWTALGLLGAVVNRKVVFYHGDIEIHGNLYILMVGPQGNGKSTANDIACSFFVRVCPDLEIGASTQSAEDIVQVMAKDEFARCFTNEVGEQIEVRPYAFFINEFKDFIAYAPVRMLNFLTNIYDRKAFKAGTIKRGMEDIINPSLNIIACENPDQMIKFMKNDIVTGGISRRFIIVNETDYSEPKPFIEVNLPLREHLTSRLIALRKVVGSFKWHPSGMKFYEPWYVTKQRSLAGIANPIMRGYISTKHVQLFKVCMLLDAVSDKPMFLFTDELLQFGLSFLDVLEDKMPLISQASGRNDMLAPQLKMLDIIKLNGGYMFEKQLVRATETDLKPMEQMMVLRHLEESDQLVKKQLEVPNSKGEKIARWTYFLPEAYELFKRNGFLGTKKQK